MLLKKITALLTASALMLLGGCQQTKEASTSATDTSAVTTVGEPIELTTEEAMLKRSLTAVGNTARFNAAVEKARSGGEVTLAYIGGSITYGLNATADTCYAALATKLFEQRFGGKATCVNAGMSGTSSLIGCVRVERDVLPSSPDIVMVEFAVNDGTDSTNQIAYESLIRTLLNSESKPAVVLVLNRLENGYTAQKHMKELGEYYDLGMVSTADALTEEFDSGRMTWVDYSDDSSHPNTEGHKLVASMLDNYFKNAAEAQSDSYSIPEAPKIGNTFENCTYYDAENLTAESLGAFKESQTMTQFPSGWVNTKNGTADPLVLKTEGYAAVAVYKQTALDSWGNCKATVNGSNAKVLMGSSADGWGGPAVTVLYSGAESSELEIEFTMTDAFKDKIFELVAIGVVQTR